MNKLVPLATILQSYAEEHFPEICGQNLFFSLTGSPSDPMVSIGRPMASLSINGSENPEFTVSSAEIEFPNLVLATSVSEAERCVAMYESGGWTQKDLSQKFNVSITTVNHWITGRSRSKEIRRSRPLKPTRKLHSQESIDECAALYMGGGWTMAELANKYETHPTTVCKWMKEKKVRSPKSLAKEQYSDELVLECKALYDTGNYLLRELADKYGKNLSTISYWIYQRSRKLEKGASTPCP